MTIATLLALDWGTSNLRASLLGRDGQVLERRSAAGGVMSVPDGRFSATLLGLCGDWIRDHRCVLIASGMVGSRQGWKEAPYLACPADVAQAARALTRVEVEVEAGATPATLHIVPGLRCQESQEAGGAFDVMRGEETQIWGARVAPGRCCVLPGTHSKWAWTGSDGAVSHFRTFMTGELYGLLSSHSILARLMVFGSARNDAFIAGVKAGVAGHAHATHVLFGVRTAGLMGTVAPEGLPDYLSGTLIGLEIGSARASPGADPLSGGVTLIGDDELCARYELALDVVGLPTSRGAADATTAGQWMIATAAGLSGALQ